MSNTSKETCILAIDGSKNAETAFNWYVNNVHKEGRQLILLHCIEPLSVVGEVPDVDSYEKLLANTQSQAKTIEDKYSDKLKTHNIDGKVIALSGSRPGELIVHTAKEEQADLVICGSRGIGKFRKTVLGSVSDYLLHHSHCAVIVIKDEQSLHS